MSELLIATATGALWLGTFLLVALLVGRRFPGEHGPALLAAFPLFFAAQVIIARLAGAAHLLTSGVFLVLYGVLGIAGIVLAFVHRRSLVAHTLAARPADDADPDLALVRRIVLGCAAVVCAGLLLFALLTPVHVWDVLAYHLPMVASYIQNASLESWPTQDLRQVFRVNAGELQMLTVALPGRSDALVELPNLLGLAILLVATFELARLEYGSDHAEMLVPPGAYVGALPYVAVAIVLTAPQILVGTATGKNDLVFTAVLLGALYWMIRAGARDSARISLYVALAGLSTAVAAATKVMGLNVLGAVGLLALLLWLRRRLAFRHVVLYGVSAIGILLVLAGDVYWKNFSRSAVPVGVTPGEVAFTFGLRNVTAAAEFYLYELPIRRLVAPQLFEHDFLHYGYVFPVLLIAGVVVALRQFRERRYVIAALAFTATALVVTVVALRLPIQWDHRFMIWLVPTLAIMALSLARDWAGRSLVAVTAAAAALALAQLALMLSNESAGIFVRSAQHLVATGELARYSDVPNPRYRVTGAGFRALDRAAAARDSVLYAGTDDSWMYPAWGARFSRHVEGVADAAHASARVGSRRFRFIVLEDDARAEIRDAVMTSAARAGYGLLRDVSGRTIYSRDGAPPQARDGATPYGAAPGAQPPAPASAEVRP